MYTLLSTQGLSWYPTSFPTVDTEEDFCFSTVACFLSGSVEPIIDLASVPIKHPDAYSWGILVPLSSEHHVDPMESPIVPFCILFRIIMGKTCLYVLSLTFLTAHQGKNYFVILQKNKIKAPISGLHLPSITKRAVMLQNKNSNPDLPDFKILIPALPTLVLALILIQVFSPFASL